MRFTIAKLRASHASRISMRDCYLGLLQPLPIKMAKFVPGFSVVLCYTQCQVSTLCKLLLISIHMLTEMARVIPYMKKAIVM